MQQKISFTPAFPQLRYPQDTSFNGYGCFIPDLTGFPKKPIQEDRVS
jgi:hypothetical protein